MALLSHNKSRGFYIIEVVVSSAIGLLIFTALASLIFYTIKTSRVNKSELKATMYLQEMIEVTKDLEQSNWNAIATSSCTSGYLYPKISGNKWTLASSTNPESLEGIYSRWLKIENVCRNPSNNAIESTGCNPSLCDFNLARNKNTKKVTAEIKWVDGSHPNMTLETFLYNIP